METRTETLTRFGENARNLRKEKNLSQEKLAELAGMDSTYISGIERGVRNPSLLAIIQLMNALGATPAKLFSGLSK